MGSLMYLLIHCTCPSQDVAEQIAAALVKAKLAACTNILPGSVSLYEWQGVLEKTQEHLLLIKSREDCYPAVEALIKTMHPYQLPEIIAVAITHASPDYLQWIDSCLLIN